MAQICYCPIQCCPGCGVGSSCSSVWTSGLGTSMCHRCSQKKKKKKKEKKRKERKSLIFFVVVWKMDCSRAKEEEMSWCCQEMMLAWAKEQANNEGGRKYDLEKWNYLYTSHVYVCMYLFIYFKIWFGKMKLSVYLSHVCMYLIFFFFFFAV